LDQQLLSVFDEARPTNHAVRTIQALRG